MKCCDRCFLVYLFLFHFVLVSQVLIQLECTIRLQVFGHLVIRIDVLGGDEECENTACIVDVAWTSVSVSTSANGTYQCRRMQSHNDAHIYLSRQLDTTPVSP